MLDLPGVLGIFWRGMCGRIEEATGSPAKVTDLSGSLGQEKRVFYGQRALHGVAK
jgi:hypothetical protein